MATIAIKDKKLEVTIEGFDKFWTMRSTLVVPLEHIVSVTPQPDIARLLYMPSGFRFLGLQIPGTLIAGTLVTTDGGGNVFCDARDRDRALGIELRGEQFHWIVVELSEETPEWAKQRIDAAIGRTTPVLEGPVLAGVPGGSVTAGTAMR